MSKRKHTHLKVVEALILSMRVDRMTSQEMADELGLSLKQVKDRSYRPNSKWVADLSCTHRKGCAVSVHDPRVI